MSLCQIIWISEAVRNFTQPELVRLLTKSRANNVLHDVTGLLLYHRQSFMQFMEGETDVVTAIYEGRIVPSALHRHVTLLLRTPVTERNFSTWSMGFMTADTELAYTVPGFREFLLTCSSFMQLKGDPVQVNRIMDGFHAGRWHLHPEDYSDGASGANA